MLYKYIAPVTLQAIHTLYSHMRNNINMVKLLSISYTIQSNLNVRDMYKLN